MKYNITIKFTPKGVKIINCKEKRFFRFKDGKYVGEHGREFDHLEELIREYYGEPLMLYNVNTGVEIDTRDHPFEYFDDYIERKGIWVIKVIGENEI